MQKNYSLFVISFLLIILFIVSVLAVLSWPEKEYGENILYPHTKQTVKRKLSPFAEPQENTRSMMDEFIRDVYRQSRILHHYMLMLKKDFKDPPVIVQKRGAMAKTPDPEEL